MFFPLHCALGWVFFRPLVLGVLHCICSNFGSYGDPPFSLCTSWGKDGFTWCCVSFFCNHCERCKIHVSRKHIHVFPPLPLALQSSHQRINIILLIDGVRTLANTVIVDSTWIDLVLWAAFSCGVVMIVELKAKDSFYHDWFSMDMFFLLAIKIFEFLHQQANDFFH